MADRWQQHPAMPGMPKMWTWQRGEIYQRMYQGQPTGKYEGWWGDLPNPNLFGSLAEAQRWVEDQHRKETR